MPQRHKGTNGYELENVVKKNDALCCKLSIATGFIPVEPQQASRRAYSPPLLIGLAQNGLKPFGH
jgi:hypothetical protein